MACFFSWFITRIVKYDVNKLKNNKQLPFVELLLIQCFVSMINWNILGEQEFPEN